MAKLKAPATAGFNAGKNFFAKTMRVADIVIDPEFSAIFKRSDKLKEELTQRMRAFGFDKNQPITVWENIVVDGHTRLQAAMDAGLEEIPVTPKEFENREEALMYTFERQVVRRNLTGPEILTAARMIPDRKAKDGTGRAAEHLADRLGVSQTTVYQARAILKQAPEEVQNAVKEGKMSIKAGYNAIPGKRPAKGRQPEKEFAANDAQVLPGNVAFLKGAVILLVEAGQRESAKLLVNHFLKKNERAGFSKLMPEQINDSLLQGKGQEKKVEEKKMTDINSSILTAQAKIGAARNFTVDRKCLGLLNDAFDRLGKAHSMLNQG